MTPRLIPKPDAMINYQPHHQPRLQSVAPTTPTSFVSVTNNFTLYLPFFSWAPCLYDSIALHPAWSLPSLSLHTFFSESVPFPPIPFPDPTCLGFFFSLSTLPYPIPS